MAEMHKIKRRIVWKIENIKQMSVQRWNLPITIGNKFSDEFEIKLKNEEKNKMVII